MFFILFAPKRDSSLKLVFIITRRLERNKPQTCTKCRKKKKNRTRGPFQASLKSKYGNHRGLFVIGQDMVATGRGRSEAK